MSSITRELTKEQLVGRAKSAWRAFFVMRDHHYDVMNAAKDKILELLTEMREKDVDPTYLYDQFKEMYEELRKAHECPICFETITKNTMRLSVCGHMVCTTCHTAMPAPKKCPICRKMFQ